MEINLPFFVEIHKMCWVAQPLAIIANFILSLVYVALYILCFAVSISLALCALPFLVALDVLDWMYRGIKSVFRKKDS